MAKSSIEWTEMTWNPTTGCTKISSGCKFCYAEIMSKRLQKMGLEKYKDAFEVRTHADQLNIPYTWKSPKIVFVNSMSDLFHKDIPLEFIKQVFKVMNDNHTHIFQVLTKRTERLYEIHQEFDWTNNIWMGVSVENENVISRVDFLRKTKAKVKFLSCEPLIGPLPNLNLKNIDWVIVGGESGYRPRPMDESWVLDIQKQCEDEQVAFFFKQWGGKNKKANGRILNGKTYNEMPSKRLKAIEKLQQRA
ncbi:MAG: phage Gp37/Gp68 family protein [Microscillaceae bacterium]|nr:phage Gp37/Gp68 family protein [Microscillaceae bacterium]